MSGLREAKCEGALINQFLRSGTSIGANVREAFYKWNTCRKRRLPIDIITALFRYLIFFSGAMQKTQDAVKTVLRFLIRNLLEKGFGSTALPDA